MLLYVAVGQVFGDLPQAVAAAEKAGGGENDVKSFSDFFEAEAYASGGDAASGMQAMSQAISEAEQVGSAPPPRAPVSTQRSYAPPMKLARHLPRYKEMGDIVGAAMASWEPHPEYEHLLSTNDATMFSVDDSGHRDDPYQAKAIRAAKEGKSFLLTGSAGVGKSYVLKRIIKLLREERKNVVVTASTGCAAVGVQGNTLHSALCLGLGKDSAGALARKIRSKQYRTSREKLQKMDVLVLDEISMVSKDLFDKAEAVVRAARCKDSSHPARCTLCPLFGKAQVILCGDFFQLPPVVDSKTKDEETNGSFAFHSRIFCRLIAGNIFRLGHVHRQDDFKFVGLLNELRLGVCTDATLSVLQKCNVGGGCRVEEVDEDGKPVCFTKLYPYRNQVKTENDMQLRKIVDKSVIYKRWTVEQPKCNKGFVQKAEDNLRMEDELELKVGARVICLKNLDVPSGIANGSPGRIIGFYPAALTRREIADQEKGEAIAVRFGTSEKIDEEIAHARNHMLAGQNKKALKEIVKKAKVRGFDLDDEDSEVEWVGDLASTRRTESILPSKKPVVGEKDEAPELVGKRLLQHVPKHPRRRDVPLLSSGPEVVPVVLFDNGLKRRVFPEPHEVRGAMGELQATIFQVPLTLAYALSVHKSQGMTLQRVQADLGGAFDCGQVYVALSRCASIMGLRLTSFDRKKVRVDKAVVEFEKHVQDGGRRLLDSSRNKNAKVRW